MKVKTRIISFLLAFFAFTLIVGYEPLDIILAQETTPTFTPTPSTEPEDPTNTPEPTQEEEKEEEPTNTPKPTIKPTNIPKPTITLTPRPSKTPTPTSEPTETPTPTPAGMFASAKGTPLAIFITILGTGFLGTSFYLYKKNHLGKKKTKPQE